MNKAELLFTLTRCRKGLIEMQCWATLTNAVQRIYSEIKLLAQIEFEMSTERIPSNTKSENCRGHRLAAKNSVL